MSKGQRKRTRRAFATREESEAVEVGVRYRDTKIIYSQLTN